VVVFEMKSLWPWPCACMHVCSLHMYARSVYPNDMRSTQRSDYTSTWTRYSLRHLRLLYRYPERWVRFSPSLLVTWFENRLSLRFL
jgi:hypothetical protein